MECTYPTAASGTDANTETQTAPVVNGEVEQEYLCEDCYEDLEDEEYHREALVRIEEIKKFKENKK